MRAHDAGQTVPISDGERGIAQFHRASRQFIGMRSPFQKREIGFAAEFRVAINMSKGEPGA